MVFPFSDFLISQILRFCARAANAGGTHGLVVGREVWGARFFDPRGLGFKSRRRMTSFWSTSLVPAYPTGLSRGRILASFFLYRYVGTLVLTR